MNRNEAMEALTRGEKLPTEVIVEAFGLGGPVTSTELRQHDPNSTAVTGANDPRPRKPFRNRHQRRASLARARKLRRG